MEKSEPTLVPEWLKNSGNQSGNGSTSHLDDKYAPKLSRNNSFLSSNGHDFGRSSNSERTTSSYFHRSPSSNGSGHLRSSNSFGRNRRDKDWEKERYNSQDNDKSVSGERWHKGFSDSLGNTLSGRLERDGLRHSQSAISCTHGDTWDKKVVTDSSSAGGNNTSALLTHGGFGSGVNKAGFERNFPSLRTEERTLLLEVGRVPSPCLSSAIQSLPIGTAAAVGGGQWTSALAEVPVVVGSNGIGTSSVRQAASTQLALGMTTSLNMAEAVAQSPIRAPVMPQISVGTQRLEELAIKQSRQLIPVTPSMPKTWVSNSSDKQKTKLSQQKHPITSLPVNHSKGDVSKSSNAGKLHVLKLPRGKNGVAPVVKDNLSPTSGINPVSSTLPTAPSVSGAAAAKGPPNFPFPNRKPVLTVLEKRTISQSQSRKEFFNLVRKKSIANSTSVTDSVTENFSSVVDTATLVSPPPSENSEKEDIPAPTTSQIDDAQFSASPGGHLLSEKNDDVTCIDDTCNVPKYFGNGKDYASMDPLFSEEEETAFLRSLGWEENSDEGGLTDEEISSFFKDATKYNSKSALRILEVVQLKFVASFDSQITGISPGLSSDAKLAS